MELLDFRMPPFARIQYVSKDIKEEWEPKVQEAANAYYELEKLTILEGLRQCTTRHISAHDIERATREFAREGLTYVPIQKVGAYQGFAHTHPPVIEGQPWNYYGVLASSPKAAYEFIEASEKGDHYTIGKLLGYPECCMDFFHNVWMKGFIDPIWQQAQGCQDSSYILEQTDQFIKFDQSVSHLTASMLRYIGVRVVPHIPCSIDCKHSHEIAQRWIEVGEKHNLKGLDCILQLVSLPIEWDCLKGIATVSTPLFKISTNSMTCYPKHVVQKEGTWYPDNAPTALKFPWQAPRGAGCGSYAKGHVKSELITIE